MIEALKHSVNWLSAPPRFFTITLAAFFVLLFPGELGPAWLRRLTRPLQTVYRPKVGGIVFAVLGVLFLASCFDPNFALIVLKPDNVPIAAMIFLVAFFVWFGLKEGRRNDLLRSAGQPIVEKQEAGDGKVMVWPDLVYTEFLCMILWTIFLIVWSICLKAPIEEPANPAKTPNPSKAPWYFLGLQEMLVYYDPWIAGVLLPGLIIIGLMATPFLDINPKGNGYFTFKDRKYEITVFLFGFVILWILLIILGTFLRGPNWNFFGPYKYWDVHYLLPLNNVNLSEFLYVKWLGIGLPSNWLLRELPGIILVILYLTVTPLVFARMWFKKFFLSMGAIRYQIMMFLLLCMFSLPIKMVLRWTFNLKYIVAIPEYFFNI